MYRGMWEDGLRSGQGVETLPDGTVINCTFVEGAPNGHGTKIFPDGKTYEGGIVDGIPNG